jgi:hypothetical protein
MLLFFLREDLAMMLSFIFTILLIILTKRYILFRYLVLSLVFALLWVLIIDEGYYYSSGGLEFLGINVYVFLSWIVWLFVMQLLFFYMEDAFFNRFPGWLKIITFIIIYWIFIITAETLSFHVFNFRNAGGQGYPGLPLCDCIHAARIVQAAYIIIGPAYILAAYLLGKNPIRRYFR